MLLTLLHVFFNFLGSKCSSYCETLHTITDNSLCCFTSIAWFEAKVDHITCYWTHTICFSLTFRYLELEWHAKKMICRSWRMSVQRTTLMRPWITDWALLHSVHFPEYWAISGNDGAWSSSCVLFSRPKCHISFDILNDELQLPSTQSYALLYDTN